MTDNSERRIGLIAGAGEVPILIARKAAQKGVKVISVSLSNEVGAGLESHVHKNYSIWVGHIGKIFKTLKSENISQIILAGKVEKSMAMKFQMFDLKAVKLFMRFKSHQDKEILEEGIEIAREEGFTVLDQREFLKELFPGKGVLTRKKPNQREMEDIKYGLPIAKYMANQEIGQTIIVKNKTVIAVEGIEGTDQAIERGCRLAHEKCVAIKVSRTNQDFRYDCPGIGPKTAEFLVRGHASVLALEADSIMLIEKEKVLALADEAGLAVICV